MSNSNKELFTLVKIEIFPDSLMIPYHEVYITILKNYITFNGITWKYLKKSKTFTPKY